MVIWILIGIVAVGAAVLGITGVLIFCTGATKKEPDCDVIIVLGHRERDGSFGITINERISRGQAYLQNHPAARAILSGGAGEAEYMCEALVAAGIQENRLILEGKSTSTWENVKFAIPITKEIPLKNVGIVSSEYHLFRAKLYLKGRDIGLIPAKTKNFPRWLHNFCREIAGVWHYFILGGQYK